MYVPIDLLGERFVPPFQPGREPVPRLEQQGKVDLVVVRVVQIEIPCITQADVVPLVEVMVGVVLWWWWMENMVVVSVSVFNAAEKKRCVQVAAESCRVKHVCGCCGRAPKAV